MLQPHFTSEYILKLSSLSWLLCGGLLAFFGWMFVSEAGVNTLLPGVIGIFSALMALALWLFSLVRMNLCRRVNVCAILFFILWLPIILLFAWAAFALFILPTIDRELQRQIQWILVGSAILWWTLQVALVRKRITKRRFLEKELFFDDDKIVFRRPPKTSLDAEPVSDKTFLGKFAYKIIPFALIVLVPLTFPLQRLAFGMGGFTGQLVFLSIFGAPLMIWVIGWFLSRAYLYLYVVSKLERQHGKPVVFSDSVV